MRRSASGGDEAGPVAPGEWGRAVGSYAPGALGTPRFGELSDAYDAYRVGYTPMVYEHLARACGLGAGADVVDLGCGTGQATRALVERGARVVAVDADEEMLAIAARNLDERARLVCAPAESLPLADGSVDLVIAAQAAHWFDEPRANDEIRRVLRPGGSVALLWKYPAPEMPYTYLVDELLTVLTGESVRRIYGVGNVPELLRPVWTDYRREIFDQPVAYTVESYVGFISSRERVRQIAAGRQDTLLDALDERLRALEPSGAFVERNLAYVVTARRAD